MLSLDLFITNFALICHILDNTIKKLKYDKVGMIITLLCHFSKQFHFFILPKSFFKSIVKNNC